MAADPGNQPASHYARNAVKQAANRDHTRQIADSDNGGIEVHVEFVIRLSYFSTKIEYELGPAEVVLLAADEGVDPARVLPRTGGAHPSRPPRS